MSTANGMTWSPFCSKYQTSSGTSYSAATRVPSRMPSGGPSTEAIRVMKWYGGPGSRAILRVPSKIRAVSPNAALGLPHAHASRDG